MNGLAMTTVTDSRVTHAKRRGPFSGFQTVELCKRRLWRVISSHRRREGYNTSYQERPIVAELEASSRKEKSLARSMPGLDWD